MIQYTAGLLFGDIRSRVLLIRKTHPKWMNNKLNGIGGHIEDNELPHDAMIREFKEETELDIKRNWKEFAILRGYSGENNVPWIVYWYTASIIGNSINYIPTNKTDEKVDWYSIRELMIGYHGDMMPNLLWLIFMAKATLEGNDRAKSFDIHEQY